MHLLLSCLQSLFYYFKDEYVCSTDKQSRLGPVGHRGYRSSQRETTDLESMVKENMCAGLWNMEWCTHKWVNVISIIEKVSMKCRVNSVKHLIWGELGITILAIVESLR